MKKENENKAEVTGAEVKPANGATVKPIGSNLPAVIQKEMDLAKTIKTVEDLFTKIKHRDRLEFYTEELKSFEVKNKPEDPDDKAYYSGCRLEIRDDNNRSFQLKHPQVIKEVIDFMFARFATRKAEIEAHIKLPNKAA